MDAHKTGSSDGDSGGVESHRLPTPLVVAIFGALLGALPAGVGISAAAAPGNAGSAIYGLLLPWSILPFAAALVVAWRCRHSPHITSLGRRLVLAGALGAMAYGYAFLFAAGKVDDRKWFAYVPLWQWMTLALPLLKTLRTPSPPV